MKDNQNINSSPSNSADQVFGRFFLRGHSLFELVENKDGEFEEKYVGNYVKIKEILQDLETKNVLHNLEYWYKGNMHELMISRKQLEVKELRKLLEKGLYVFDSKVNKVAYFLSVQEDSAPIRNVHHQMGWSGDVFKHYNLIGPTDIESTYEGELELQAKGTLQGWLDVINRFVIERVELQLGLVFGFTAPIVGMLGEELDMETLVVHLYGDTTNGKTTTMRIAVSPFGKPSFKEGGLLQVWRATMNALTGRVVDNRGIPVVFDEASTEIHKAFKTFIYILAGGRDKDRMTKELELRKRRTWATTILSTAEHSLLDQSNQNTGLIMRISEFANFEWTQDKPTAEAIKKGLLNHYGHAGPLFVEYLTKLGKEEVLEKWQSWVNTCMDSMPKVDQLTGRISNKLAIIMVTAELVKEALDLDLNLEGILQLLVDHEQKSMVGRDLGERAYDYFKQVVIKHRSKFVGDYFGERGYECWGKITPKGSKVSVNILTNSFKTLMEEGGFLDMSVILKNWKGKGYLQTEPNKLTQRKRISELDDAEEADTDRSGRSTTYCIVFKKQDLEFNQAVKDYPPKPKKVKKNPKNML